MIDLVKLHQAATHAQVEGYLLKWNGSEIRQLVDQLQAAQKDASRYHWLRDEHIGDDPESINLDRAKTRGLDAAIDAAMESDRASNGGKA